MKRTTLIIFLLLTFCAAGFGFQSTMVGGYRSGFSLGIITDEPFGKFIFSRFGVLVKSDQDNPLILFLGRGLSLGQINSMPSSLKFSLTGYFGNNTIGGVSLSYILENFAQQKPLVFEIGSDFVGGEINPYLQFGWKLGY